MDATQLKRISIFEDVPEEDLRVITTFATTDEEGQAEVRRGGEKIGELGPGDIFGELGLLEREKRGATVVAKSRVRMIKIERWELERMKKVLPHVYEKIQKVAGERRPSPDEA